MNAKKRILELDSELLRKLADRIVVKNRTLRLGKGLERIPTELPYNLIEFYKEIECFELEWEAREITFSKDILVYGRIRILKPEEVLQDWDGIVYSKEYDPDSELKDFKIVDFVEPEIGIGYMQSDHPMDFMRYYTMRSETESLDLDFKGYLDMMLYARGACFWQGVVLHLRNQSYGFKDSVDYKVEEFKTYMPQLFPDFKWEDFVALYERVRIK